MQFSHQFARKLGFGLGPDETAPSDPVAWAVGQLDAGPPMDFLANRQGAKMTGLPEGLRLRESQAETTAALRTYNDAEEATNEASKRMGKEEWAKFRYETYELPVWGIEPWKETLARAAMAVNGPAPVFERFWHFWANHFTVAPGNNRNEMAIGPYMRMLRTHMAGSFRDMLFEAVTHPAMVMYLDNVRSTGPRSKARRERWTTDEINENLGREMLELFTVSPAAGYTQDDVIAATMILTGWGVNGNNRFGKSHLPQGSYFNFDRHEPGTQTVMGKKYSALVHNDSKLKELIDDLAAHPATARHIATKLATAFIADSPPPAVVERLAAVFTQSKGHLPAVHKAVVQEVARAGPVARKFQDPQTWLWTIFRTTGANLSVVVPQREVNGERYHNLLNDLGQPVHHCPQPNGWSLFDRDWISGEMLDRRIRYAFEFSRRLVARDGGADGLRQLIERQHGPQSSAVLQQIAGNPSLVRSPRELWTAYLVSPWMLWS